MRKIILALFVFIFPQVLLAQQSPVPMLENSANKIIESLKSNQSSLKSNHLIAYQAIQRYLLPHVDLIGMSRSVLGRKAWDLSTSTEKKEFTDEFTALVIRTYASPLAEYSGEKVTFLPIRGSSDVHFIRVNSIISRPNGQNIPLSYSLVVKNGEWKIYDFNVEGVSLLQSFHSQFGEMLQNKSMHDLIKQMHDIKKAA